MGNSAYWVTSLYVGLIYSTSFFMEVKCCEILYMLKMFYAETSLNKEQKNGQPNQL